MNTLGGISLPSGLVWQQAGHAMGRKTVLRQTLDGTPVVFAGAAPSRITLIAGDDHGWIDAATKDALLAFAAANNTATLEWEGTSHTVAFDHESGPAILLEPLWIGAAYYSGTLNLIIL